MLPLLQNKLGIYEKGLHSELSWAEKLEVALQTGFDFIELCIDESDEKIARLEWSQKERQELRKSIERAGCAIPMLSLSATRRFPMGSTDATIRQQGREILRKTIELAADLQMPFFQISTYDVYYEPRTEETGQAFLAGLESLLPLAEKRGVLISMEVMDVPFSNSIAKLLAIVEQLDSPNLRVFADFGNICAWEQDLVESLEIGKNQIHGVHLKDSKPGVFRDVPFGEGTVDFQAGLTKLHELNYGGLYSVETWCHDAPDYREKLGSIRQWLSELETGLPFPLFPQD